MGNNDVRRRQLKPLPDVRPGQVWEDCNWRTRNNPRRIRVVEVASLDVPNPLEVPVVVENVAKGNRSTIRLRRFKPNSTGYRLVAQVDEQQRQDSLTAQMLTVLGLAQGAGCRDAADWIRKRWETA